MERTHGWHNRDAPIAVRHVGLLICIVLSLGVTAAVERMPAPRGVEPHAVALDDVALIAETTLSTLDATASATAASAVFDPDDPTLLALEERYVELITQYFHDDAADAIEIVRCESRFQPWAVGTNRNGTRDHGLFQINDVHASDFEAVTGASWTEARYDSVANVMFAAWLHRDQGWQPWTCASRLD